MRRAITNIREVRRLPSGRNAWTVVDDHGTVRHILTGPNFDADTDYMALLQRAVDAHPMPKLTYPNDVWQDTDERE